MKLHQLLCTVSGKIQKYKMPHNNEGSRELARPGQFVHESNDSDLVAGFITSVDEHSMTFCLFDAIDIEELPKGATAISGEITKDEMAEELRLALELNPSMKPYWVRAINGEVVQ